ncbi:unnamed protein product [Darwinula stevensoni]|uniref:Kelch domain-containing protein 4 n=1 Tax=Darwinula stevensoni TaxID=69355 RepID=A0A7R8XH33_9CRUS|nr:unnamed protein product [Darwinula stevensoni]CAG0892096.1 unnamed protein product [Darwinula stevensoni]
MGKKDKKKVKGRGAQKTSSKTEKKLSQKQKREMAARGEEDIETILQKIMEEEKKKTKVIVKTVGQPSIRSNFSLCAHPEKDMFILFGGEFFNAGKTYVYNDLYFYNLKKNEWVQIESPNSPPPRCAHQACTVAQDGGQMWLFGGEFTSVSETQFYHYKDLWILDLKATVWKKIHAPGAPSSRSGHRMVHLKKLLVVFGGFHDKLSDYKYFNDVHIFNLETYQWHKVEPSGTGPSPRSGHQMCALPDGRILIYGGYSKVKLKKDLDSGVTHTDMFLLIPDKHDEKMLKWRWCSLKSGGIPPSPRCGFTMTIAPGPQSHVWLFGGVSDEESPDHEELSSCFHNDLYSLDINAHTWKPISVTKGKVGSKRKRRRRKQPKDGSDTGEDMEVEDGGDSDDGEEMETVHETEDGFTVRIGPSKDKEGSVEEVVANLNLGENGASSRDVIRPCPRMNPGMFIKHGILYLYGGFYEDEKDRRITLGDLYTLGESARCQSANPPVVLYS